MPQFDIIQRQVTLSVSEFAGFRQRIGVVQNKGYSNDPWRMRRGQAWHQSEHATLADSDKDGRSEHPIEAKWQHQGWLFNLRGRVDQIEFADATQCLIREIKTVGTPLPQSETQLLTTHGDYFNQLATYMLLAGVMPATAKMEIKGELLFIDPTTGIRQSCILPLKQARVLFEQQLAQWLIFLSLRERSWMRRKALKIRPAFSEWREGQETVLNCLQEQSGDPRPLLLEAPTGFGKTGVILQYALEALRTQRFERIIYLTGKSTGQLETLRQIQHMAEGGLLIIPMRNRREHAQGCFCQGGGNPRACAEACHNTGNDSIAVHDPENYFNDAVFDVESARTIAAKQKLCPYSLTRSLLPFADIWIGDFNYIFAPSGKTVFEDCPGFQPQQTLLIIDEAHNLPERVASAMELQLDAWTLSQTIAAANELGARWQDATALPALENWLEECQPNEGLDLSHLYDLIDLLEHACDCLQRSAIPWEDLDIPAAECLASLPRWLTRLEADMQDWLCWSPKNGCLRMTCLDPGNSIAATIAPFAKTVLMSATLQPFQDFAAACGFPDDNFLALEGMADWREGAYRVAVDCRVDTRLKSRAKHYAQTAETLIACCTINAQPPIAAFFPSYSYAEAVREYIAVLDPALRVALQPRGETLANQADFIETALLMSDVLFLILGSGFSEGIDQLGGRINRIVVVSLSLPEVNAIQNARMQRLRAMGNDREQAFHNLYRIPGMRKIRQALGRVVRAPGQQAEVLLHCQRFAEEASSRLLAPDYSAHSIIRNNVDLHTWLQGPEL
jgi:DNA excision repair protein ERCC-2